MDSNTILCLLACTYVMISLLVSMHLYNSVPPAGDIGMRAQKNLNAIAGKGEARGLRTGASRTAMLELKKAVNSIVVDHPGRIEVKHQDIRLTPENIFGPFAVPACNSIVIENCTNASPDGYGDPVTLPTYDGSTCAMTCPFDRSKPSGARCCGDPDSKNPILPAFPSLVSRSDSAITDVPRRGTIFTNIVFRVRGNGKYAGDNQSILVASHWDSVWNPGYQPGKNPAEPSNNGPGVSDDLAGPAVQLEVARELAASTPLDRDVIFLFVSGEEVADMGSVIFRQFHEWRHRPTVAINVEGKGTARSKIWLIRACSAYAAQAYIRHVRMPVGYSFSDWIFANMNIGYTDLDIYRRARYNAMDLVYVHDSYVYHTPDDNVNHSSPGGLQHQGDTLIDLLRGVASDPAFPSPVSTEQDHMAGAWNNEFLYDPGMTSRTFYCSLFNTFMWSMSQSSAKVLFASTAVISPVAVVIIAAQTSRVSLKEIVLGAAINAAIFLGYMILGIASSAAFYNLGVRQRDLRTWYDWPYVRLAFLTMSSIMPVLVVELLRKSASCCKGCVPDRTLEARIGTLFLFSGLLLLTALALADIGFTFFWFSACSVVAAGIEVVFFKLQCKQKRDYAVLTFLNDCNEVSGITPKQDSFVELFTRDLVTIFAPTLLSMGPWFNLVLVLSYIIDSIDLGIANALLVGLLSMTFFLPLVPIMHRLTASSMKIVCIVLALFWAGLLLACISVPTDTAKACYFDLTCSKSASQHLAARSPQQKERLGPWSRLHDIF